MQKILVLLSVAAGAAMLCNCAARPAEPVHMMQTGDDSLSCSDLGLQIASNRASATMLIRKDKNVENGNIAKGVGSAIPYLGILLAASTDLSNKEQIEARALIDRDERLIYLYKNKDCSRQTGEIAP